jgi:NitT/TauT family transport system ATP-binding protein
MAKATPLLELRGVTQAYGSGAKRFVAVEGVDLQVADGEFVALLGPSGCGKSTLLRIITGLQRSSEGQVLYRGSVLQGVNPHATIVFQSFALFPWLTVQHNVELGLKARGVPREARREKAVALLDKVGLDGFESAFPRELSGGMRQKVGFARAMAVEPELLCLDEPFSALDVLSAEALRGELQSLWQGGELPTKAILLVTHNIDEAVFMADRIVVMEKEPGRVVCDVRIDLPHPRSHKSPEFLKVVDAVYGTLAGTTEAEHLELGTAPGEPGRTRALPDIDIPRLAAMLERLDEEADRTANIYDIAHDLKVESDDMLGLTEAAELLGFCTIDEGDVTITDLGTQFARANITERKDIFAARIRRLPLFVWLLGMLEAENDHRLEWDVVQKALEIEFPTAEAERIVETAVEWGRYGELVAYDDARESIFLEGFEEQP